MRRRFVETALQQKGTVTAHHAIQAMEEEAAEVGGRRKLANVLDVSLPTQQWGCPQGAVLGTVIDVEPRPQALVELFEGESLFAVQVVQELFPACSEEPFHLSASFGLIWGSVHNQRPDRGRNPRQLRATIDFGVIHVQPDRGAP